MMDAFVYLKSGEWNFLLVNAAGTPVDHAGPFDDEYDAVMAARRATYGIGTVRAGEAQ